MIKQIISAEAILINEKIYMRAYSQTTMGMGRADNPIYVLEKNNFHLLGEKILETFKDCKMGIPHPDYTQKQPKDEMLILTGSKTDKALAKSGKHVAVTVKDGLLDVSPMYFNGQYLTGSPERHILCSLDPNDITKTVLKAFERCHP